MQTLRQLGGGVIIAIVSVILVIGGIFLSLAETLPPPSTPTQIPPTFPESFPTPTGTSASETPSSTQTELPTATPSLALALGSPTSCTPPSGWVLVTTRTGDTVYSLAQRYKTTAENLNTANCLTSAELPVGVALYVPPVPTVTVIPCGPPFGWVRNYIVQRGDTLFRIALAYNITYPQLQRANCMGSSTTIYTGQRLWVPNIPPRTPVPGVTIIPTIPTETPATSYP
ncbi:MAG TPA: LysM peptidoglycan-binding domain-containing protein [Anaerolineales bacterium]|nr:LysM peptidoglycan-binding domain-containing protein [Anaerolineales bacterium]